MSAISSSANEITLTQLAQRFCPDAIVETTQRGIVTSSDGLMQVAGGVIPVPDVAIVDRRQLPHRQLPLELIPQIYPHLAVEVLSASNTPTVLVFTAPEELTEEDVLEGGEVLPGFTLPFRQLFTRLDPQ